MATRRYSKSSDGDLLTMMTSLMLFFAYHDAIMRPSAVSDAL
jgi:hypothetical protein